LTLLEHAMVWVVGSTPTNGVIVNVDLLRVLWVSAVSCWNS